MTDAAEHAPPDGETAEDPLPDPSGTDNADSRPSSKEHEALMDRFLRLGAEFENFKKRTEKERKRDTQRVRENLLRDFLEVADSVERALGYSDGADDVWIRGTEQIMSQLREVLLRNKVSAAETGETFDPLSQEAVGAIPNPTRKSGDIAHVERRGYRFDDGRILRNARVIVVKNA
jgi:molecular chaperone GrpE